MWIWLSERFSERSTWLSLLNAIGVLLGAGFNPEQVNAIITIGIFVSTAIAIAMKEKK